MDYDALMPVLRRLAIEAGSKIMEIYEADDFDVVGGVGCEEMFLVGVFVQERSFSSSGIASESSCRIFVTTHAYVI